MPLTRRQFCQWLGESGVLAHAAVPLVTGDDAAFEQSATAAAQTGSHIGNLYPFVQQQADRSPLELSFLRQEFRSLKAWQEKARALGVGSFVLSAPAVHPDAQMIRRDRARRPCRGAPHIPDDTGSSCSGIRTGSPKGYTADARNCRPSRSWRFLSLGKRKTPGTSRGASGTRDIQAPVLWRASSTSVELARRGYVVIVIDMFYWGERRMLLDDDPANIRTDRRRCPRSGSTLSTGDREKSNNL